MNLKQFSQGILYIIEHLILSIKHLPKEFGFESFPSVLKDSLFLHTKYMGIYFITFLGGIGIAVWDYVSTGTGPLHEYIQQNIYNPSKAILWLFIIMLIDILFGITKARSNSLVNIPQKIPELPDGNKFLRSVIKFLVQIFFITFLTNIALLYEMMAQSLLIITHGIMLAFMMATFLSAWNNAYLLGFIQKEVHEFVVGLLDIKNILSIFKSVLPKNNENEKKNGDDSPNEGASRRDSGNQDYREN